MISRSRLLVTLTVLGGLAIVASIVFMLATSLDAVATKTNELDAERAEQSVRSALGASLASLRGVVADNAVWTQAYEVVSRDQLDLNWLQETWGTTAEAGTNYNGAAVLDKDLNVLWGYSPGIDFGEQGKRVFHGRLENAGLRLPPIDTEAQEGIVDLGGPLALVSVGLVVPTEGDAPSPAAPLRYLLYYRLIDDALLAEWSAMFGIEGLTVSKKLPGNAIGVDLISLDGRQAGSLSWKARSPGEAAAAVVRPKILFVLAAVCLLVAALVGLLVFGLKQVARSEAKAQQAALTDNLTKLPNRHALTLAKAQLLKGATVQSVALALIDIDQFKTVNDTYGPEIGDLLLVRIASALRDILPKDMMICRNGADEFAVLATGPAAERAVRDAIVSLQSRLPRPFDLDGRLIQVGLSIGIATNTHDCLSAEELFRRAEGAMQVAKANGDRLVVFDPVLDEDRRRRAEIEGEIRAGIERGEFTVAYQPIVDAGSRLMHGVEALARWPGRPGGPLRPDEFIPVAETSGLIHDLGLYVLCRACLDWADRDDILISVNVSPVQFHDPRFEAYLAEILRETGLPAERLELEVTEGYLIDQPKRAKEVMSNLRSLGVRIALDDFGTGFTSIGYLRDYRFDKLKIDRSLAGQIDQSKEAAVLVASTIMLANGLSMTVTAEGVETFEQASLLTDAGCHQLQGYLFGRPDTKLAIGRRQRGHTIEDCSNSVRAA